MGGVPLLALAWLAQDVSAQRLQGRVVDGATRQGVAAATMEVVSEAGEVVARAETDSLGAFVLELDEAGRYRLRVEHLAYRAVETEEFEVGRTEALELEVRVGHTVIPLEPLVIEARRDRGRLAGYRERLATDPFGKFVTREEIDARPTSTPTDLMQGIPGVTLRPVGRVDNPFALVTNMIVMRGTSNVCEPAIYVDGVKVVQSRDAPIDDLLNSPMLEGIEVYTTLGSAPAEYRPTNNCGVVLFWTREAEGTGRRGLWRIVAGLGAFATILLLTGLR